MCKYCKFRSVIADGKDNEVQLISKLKDGSQVFELKLFRYEDDNEKLAELIIEESVDSESGLVYVKQKTIKIKYCPFCGEEL